MEDLRNLCEELYDLATRTEWSAQRGVYGAYPPEPGIDPDDADYADTFDMDFIAYIPACPSCMRFKEIPETVWVRDAWGSGEDVTIHPEHLEDVGHKESCEMGRVLNKAREALDQ